HWLGVVQAERDHGLPVLPALPPPVDVRERRVRYAAPGREGNAARGPRAGDPATRRPARPREPEASSAFRWAAAARRPRARARQQARRAAARRAAWRARPQAAQADTARKDVQQSR